MESTQPECEWGASQMPEARLIASLEWLVDTQAAIRRDGVSQSDVATLNALSSALDADNGPTCVALESYRTVSFTEERSSVNLDLALEGFGSAVLRAIQRLWRAILASVSSAVGAIKKMVESETITRFYIERLYKAVGIAGEGSIQLEKKFLRSTAGVQEKLDKYRGEILASSDLKKTPLQVGVLGDPEHAARIRTSLESTLTSLAQIEQYFDRVRSVMGNPSSSTNALENDRVFDELMRLSWVVDDLTKTHKEKDYITANRKLSAFPDRPHATVKLNPRMSTTVSYGKVLNMYEKVEKELKQIYSSNLVGEDEDLKPVLAGLNRASVAVGQLSRCVRFRYQYNQALKAALQGMYRFENKRFTLCYQAAKETVVTDIQKESLEKTRNQYTQLLASLLA